MADQISDTVLDALLAQDKKARVACETMVKTGLVVIAGEITTTAYVISRHWYARQSSRLAMTDLISVSTAQLALYLMVLASSPPDIAQGVDRAAPEEQGAGDQGLMFGYASNETDVLMPAPITYSHRLVEQQAKMRRSGTLPWLRPDAKSQVTLRYSDGKPVGIDAVVLSTQHDPEVGAIRFT